MAVVTTKSGFITNRDAGTGTLSNPQLNNIMKNAVGTVEGANGDSIASKFIMAQVPSNARVSKVLLSCDAISTSGAADCGIYRSTADGGAVVDADFFASAVVLTAALNHSNITHEADPTGAGAGYGQEDVEKPLWQALGLTADPSVYYDVVLTLTAALGGAGTVSLEVEYV